MKSLCSSAVFLALALAPLSSWAGTSEALLMRGTGKTLSAVMSVPAGMLNGAARGGFPFGMIGGAVQGSVTAVSRIFSGAFDLARGAAPYAKYAVFL